ncbi:GGDEF domain-containing protein [Arenimonas sp.]|uniref:sensor domain-containing diguanylate cyclase n=1 Tax=Arenimonas sp. TaxID=1872635 RepID=UPI0035B2D23D
MIPSPSLRLASAALCTALVLLAPAMATASPAFDAMLRQAEAVRSSDPGQFDTLLGQLNASIASASDRQREQLDYLKAYQLAYGGRFDLGIEAARKLFEESADVEVRFRAGALMVNSFAVTRDFASGLRYMNETLALVDQVEDPELRHHAWSAAGTISNHVGQYDRGKHFAELMLGSEPSARTRCFAEVMRLESLYYLDEVDGKTDQVADIARQCSDAGEKIAANFARTFHARILADGGQRNEAAILLARHLPEAEATRYPRLIGEVHSTLAGIYLDSGDATQADAHARAAIRFSASMVNSAPLVTAYRALYESALLRGDTAAALAHHINYAEADKAFLDSVKARELAYQEVMSETREKNQTIELLNRENQVLQLREQVSTQSRRNNQLLVALLVVLLGTIAFWAWRTKRAQVMFRRLAETDALTGAANRMHFGHRAEEALAYCRKAGEEVGLVMFDLDEFKSINDRFGHATGDWVLREVAKACTEVCRKNDRFGRLGGEEFAFLLVGCDLPSSVALAQACRKRIAAIDTTPTGYVFKVTASFGVAGTRASGYDFLTLLSRADDALYQAKHAGRDRVRTHGLEMDTTEIAAT